MGTRSVIAVQQGDGWHGRYCHWDGYPSHLGAQLLRLHRDKFKGDLEKMISVLTEKHYGWSALTEDPRLEGGTTDGRFKRVAGVGIAYTTKQGQSSKDDWITSDGDDSGTEWAYVLTRKGIVVFERTFGAEGHATGAFGMNNDGAHWSHRGMVTWGAPAEAMEALEIRAGASSCI